MKMGITIFYKGKIDTEKIPAMVEEVKDIANSLDWRYFILDDGEITESTIEKKDASEKDDEGAFKIEETLPLTGIMLCPADEFETFSLLFDPEGDLTDFIQCLNVQRGESKEENLWVYTKTQFAVIETHITLIELLR